jgi:adenosylcobalamin-dependent ribonucleoside-diphosphate reductase
MPESKEKPILPKKRTRGETLKERLTDNAYRYILPTRYLMRDEKGEIVETAEEMFRRVADNVAQPDGEYGRDVGETANRFYEAMTQLEFMPNSPTLMNAGARLQQLAACFVLLPRDDLNAIFDTLRQAALVLQTGGGVGYSFSLLRPKGDIVQSTGGIASGPVSFMKVYNAMCGALKQGGKRRGAQMAILRVDHPDIGRFIVAKRQEGELANFNISVAITDAFMEAVDRDEDYPLINPRTGAPFQVAEQTAQFYSTEYEDAPRRMVEENFWRDDASEIEGIDAFRGRTDLVVGEAMRLPARFIWHVLIDGAWRNGEPGILMIDETNRDHSFDVQKYPEHEIRATNPCGEQPLEEYEACGLGHVNLSLIVAEGAPLWAERREQEGASLEEQVAGYLQEAVDWEHLRRIVRVGTHFLDNAVTMSAFPLREIVEKQKGLRNIGLGIMGFAQMLVQMGVVYGSDASFEIARQIMAYVNRESKLVSHELAEERGAFRGWADSKYARPTDYTDWFRRHTGLDPQDWPYGLRLRNHHTTTIAPTGTTSMIANTSGGCEPIFDIAYLKNVGEDIQGEQPLVEFDDYFLLVLEANGIDVEAVRAEAEEKLRDGRFEDAHSLSIPDEIADLFISASEIPPEGHVRMQAAFQHRVDSAISKTINFTNEATHEDVRRAYELAINLGCKGITVYRLGSRREQVLTSRAARAEGKESAIERVEEEYGSLDEFLHQVADEESRLCPQCGIPLRRTFECQNCDYGR